MQGDPGHRYPGYDDPTGSPSPVETSGEAAAKRLDGLMSLAREQLATVEDLDAFVARFRSGRAASEIAGGDTEELTVTWDTPFDDTNYSVATQVHTTEGVLGTSVRLLRITAVTPTSISVSVRNDDGLQSLTATVHAVAIHD